MAGQAPYGVCKPGEEMVCGIFDMAGRDVEGAPERWMSCFTVDAAAAARAAATTGGAVLRTPFDVAGEGRIVMMRDSGGAEIGLIEPGPPAA